MKPSAISPVSASALGPYAATQIGSRDLLPHGKRTWLPRYCAVSPLASGRITSMLARRSAKVTGLPLITRTAESPRPIPQIVRLPNISLSVANSEAVTVQSRVAGLVTIGPTITLRVAASIWL